MSAVTEADLSNDGFPYGTTQEVLFGSLPVRLFRISYVGDLGWEIYVPMENGLAVWDALWRAGQDHGVVAVGAGVYGTSGRLEKGYRLMGAELGSEYNPVEAGLARPKVKSADFLGKEAYLAAREEEPAAILCTLTVEDHVASSDGVKRYMTGSEPILTPSGERIVDRKGRPSYVTSAGAGPSVGQVPAAGLPPARARRRRHGPRGHVHGRPVPRPGGRRRQHAAVRPRRHPDEVLSAMAAGDGVRVLVCVKRVPAPGARIALTADGQDIDTKNLGFTTSPHEECAVEEAIRLVEAHGGSTTVLTVGPPAADEQLRYALSVGAGAAVLVTTDGPDPDAQATARALVRAIGALEAAGRARSTSSCSATSRPTPAGSRSASGSPGRSAARSSTGSRASSSTATAAR